MNPNDIDLIESLTPDRINQSSDPDLIYRLLGIIESCITEISELKQEVQSLRDEVNHLKGEKGKPIIRKSCRQNDDYSSEEERKSLNKNIPKGRQERNSKVIIHREEICPISPEILPPDAIFKGYSTVIVQNLKVEPDNVRFLLEKYYSPSTGKTYTAPRPDGYEGEYGPGVKSLILGLKYCCNVSEPAIGEFLKHHGVLISGSTISRYLTKNLESFHEEKKEITLCGLSSTSFQQMDDTGARVNGQQYYTQILCNQYYTTFHTIPHKDRLSIIRILLGDNPLQFLFNEEAFELLNTFKLPLAVISFLKNKCSGLLLDEQTLNAYLLELPTRNKSIDQIHRRIKEASGIAWYHDQTIWPVVSTLLTDDAPQYDHITKFHALCWVHAARSLKKLNPLNPAFKEILKTKLDEFWEYYRLLAEFKDNPIVENVNEIELIFNEIFDVEAGYQTLDDRFKVIAKNKEKLLQVLRNPEIPLHNNASELGARAQVRKRDVSLHTITQEGTKAVDTFLSLRETAKKLGVNFFQYLHDRITKNGQIERLGDTILHKAGLPLNDKNSFCTS